jgi:hypothetical protein
MKPDYVLSQFADRGRIITYEHDIPLCYTGYGETVYAIFKVRLKPVKYWRRTFLEKVFPAFFDGIVKRWMLSRRIVSQVNGSVL